MSVPAIKILKKSSIENVNNKDEQQIIQINVSQDPVEIFSPVPIVGLSPVDDSLNAQVDVQEPQTEVESEVPMDIIQLELEASDDNTISHQTEEITGDKSNHGDNVFMIPRLLRVRQFAVQERLPISISEIRRRIGPPESLSQALVLSLLRLNKERAKHLRKALSQFGIKELPARSAVVSSFSRLSEVEAACLAEDYYYLASRFMKVKDINSTLVAQNGGEMFFSSKANTYKRILQQILCEIEKRDSDLNLLTHGFSPLILRAVFNILIELLMYKEKEPKDLIFEIPRISL